MKEIPIKYLKTFLDTQTKESLVKLILDLFKRSAEARNFFSLLVDPANADRQLVEETKHAIDNEFFPERGEARMSLAAARKAISDYKKMPHSVEGLAEVMAYYVEVGVAFTNTYGDINEAFYNSIASMYDSFLKYITQNGLEALYKARALAIVTKTSEIGWGFHDELSEMYGIYMAEE
jgi:hypothetical protein